MPTRSRVVPREFVPVAIAGAFASVSSDRWWIAAITGDAVETRDRATLELVRREPVLDRLLASMPRWIPRTPVVAWVEDGRWVAA